MFPYFGGKRRLAPTYPGPLYDTVIEPFAGSAGYGMYWLERRPRLDLIIVEQNPTIAALWRRLLEPNAAKRVAALPDVIKGDKCDDPLIALANASFSSINACHNSGEFTVSEWTAELWPRVRQQVADRCRIAAGRVTVIEGDYTDAPTLTACWFVDPPYQHQGHLYKHGNDGIDYAELNSWCQTRPGQVIVTEAEPADWLPFEPHRRTINVLKQDKTELVWYDPDHAPLRLFANDET